ncbi:signal transduction histidine kinase [Sinorhizobium fredii]|uniref:histidine kinase n=1 Tax=Sinorhizobium fredii (strain USDA 257) TaxID=1185652 RepID=I3XFH3_SINF2|nr:sensor histidine kinase [Sinorhizobium fredii]AFL54629.1 putative sensory transduction histidine kinase [Sinorhizobium fredii USDA 257]
MMRSLRLRLAVGAVIAIGLVLLVAWLSLTRLFTDYVVGRYRGEMMTIVDTLAAELALQEGQLMLAREPADPRFDLPNGGRYWQVSPVDGSHLRSRSLWDVAIDADAPVPSRYEGFTISEGPDGHPMLVHSQSLSLGEGAPAIRFVASAAFPKRELDEALGDFQAALRLMLLATAGLLAAAAFFQNAIGLKPLRRLSERAASVRAGRDRDFGTSGPSEVQPLVSEINLLLKEREVAVERARARASDLAHGLKTPLTVLAQLAERLPPEDRALALRQVELARQRADRQLQAARMGVERMATTSVMGLGGKLVSVLRPVTAERDVAWEVSIDSSLSLDVDPADLAECLGNLLDNAAKWARSFIRFSARRANGAITILIEDDGPGIAEQNRVAILRRGARLDSTDDREPEGAGLGLAISADIAEAYGASLTLEQSDLGGLRARLTFPVRVVRLPVRDPA